MVTLLWLCLFLTNLPLFLPLPTYQPTSTPLPINLPLTTKTIPATISESSLPSIFPPLLLHQQQQQQPQQNQHAPGLFSKSKLLSEEPLENVFQFSSFRPSSILTAISHLQSTSINPSFYSDSPTTLSQTTTHLWQAPGGIENAAGYTTLAQLEDAHFTQDGINLSRKPLYSSIRQISSSLQLNSSLLDPSTLGLAPTNTQLSGSTEDDRAINDEPSLVSSVRELPMPDDTKRVNMSVKAREQLSLVCDITETSDVLLSHKQLEPQPLSGSNGDDDDNDDSDKVDNGKVKLDGAEKRDEDARGDEGVAKKQWKLFWVNSTSPRAILDRASIQTTKTQVILSIPPPHSSNHTYSCLVQDPFNHTQTIKIISLVETPENVFPVADTSLSSRTSTSQLPTKAATLPSQRTINQTNSNNINNSNNSTKNVNSNKNNNNSITIKMNSDNKNEETLTRHTLHHYTTTSSFFHPSSLHSISSTNHSRAEQTTEGFIGSYIDSDIFADTSTYAPIPELPSNHSASNLSKIDSESLMMAALEDGEMGEVRMSEKDDGAERNDIEKRLMLGMGLAVMMALTATALVLYRRHRVGNKSNYITFGNPSFSSENLPANEYSLESPLTLSSNGYTVLA